jgi:3-oxoacyl-[acyl-carrier protein] reductase
MATRITPVATLPLEGRIAVVTGACLVLNYASNSARADSLAAELNSQYRGSTDPPRAVTAQADVSDPDAVQSLFDKADSSLNGRWQ